MQKRLLKILTGCALACLSVSCVNDTPSNQETYKKWREYNEAWLIEQTNRTNPDGTPYYKRCTMPSDPMAYVLMHTIGEVHTENLKPLFSSTTKVNYTLRLANDSIMDQNSGYVTQLSSKGFITGWSLAIMQLHVGDSAQFVLPYNVAYGESGNGFGVDPYSNLMFNIKLVDIEGYEVLP